MKTPDSDGITRFFEENRLADESAAPDLATLLVRPRRRAEHARGLRALAWTAAALAAVAAVVVLRTGRSHGGAAPEASVLPPEAIALSTWKSPTDAFLETPGLDLWTQVPDLAPAATTVDRGAPLATTKGVER
jgi:hypothetical protein